MESSFPSTSTSSSNHEATAVATRVRAQDNESHGSSIEQSQTHALLYAVYHPTQPVILYFDVSRSHRDATIWVNYGSQPGMRSIPQEDLLSPAFTSNASRVRLFFDIPNAPRWVDVWTDISLPTAITLREVLARIFYQMQSFIAQEPWRALKLSPALPDMEAAFFQRLMHTDARDPLLTPGQDLGEGGICWVDALGGRTWFQGLKRADWHYTSKAKFSGAPAVQESWVAHFGYNPFATS